MNPASCIVDVRSENHRKRKDGHSDICLKFTYKNEGDTVVIVQSATARVCFRLGGPGCRQRYCTSIRHSVRFEVDGKSFDEIVIPMGETVVFNGCTSLQAVSNADHEEIDIELYEKFPSQDFIRSILIAVSGCN